MLKRYFANKSVFARCMSALLLCVLIVFITFILTLTVATARMREADIRSEGDKFSNAVEGVERCLNEMKYTYAEISLDPTLIDVIGGRCETLYPYARIIEKIRGASYSRSQNEFVPYLDGLFLIMPRENKTVVGSDGTFMRDNFFAFNFNNEKYNDDFWCEQMESGKVFSVYPAATFNNVSNADLSKRKVIPISYKLPANKNFIFVSLFNIEAALIDMIGEYKSVRIVDTGGNTIFSGVDTMDYKGVNFTDGVSKNGKKYVFENKPEGSNMVYYHAVPAGELFADTNKTIAITWLLALIALAGAVAISFFMSKRAARAVSALSEKMANSKIHTCDALPTNSAEYIQNSVTALIEQNENYAASISEKDSLLRAIFLQSRMRDIYVSIEDVENQIDISQTYVMLYMRVHYKEEFYQSIQEEQGKSTFFLKQLIELYLGTAKMSATTFQIENDQIVSIISTSDEQEVMDSVHTMIKKLDNESDYVFFTIVVSHLHDDVGALKANFDKMSEIARYAKPRMETQVLIEDEQRQGAGNFHFTIEQMEKLSALMQNDPLGDSLQNVAEIFEYNERKDISGFGLYLLSTEIVNCCLKLVNRLFHVMPPSIKVSQIYAQLDRAVTVEQHQRICTDLVRDVVEYIKLNKRDEDYIISFILGYVEEHYAEDIYLNLFAEKLKLTAAYISSYFKEKMNVNLSDYINSYRIKKAISLIENPQNKNKDIAEMVGLQNINTFIRLFKKYTGYTPGEYKKKHFSE